MVARKKTDFSGSMAARASRGLFLPFFLALCAGGTTAQAYDASRSDVSTNRPPSDMSSLLSGKPAGLKATNRADRVEASGDTMDYDRKTGWITATGHVVVRKGEEELRADTVRVNVLSEEAHAVGNVVLKRPGAGMWRGPRLYYNFKTKTGDAPGLVGDISPFHVETAKTEKVGPNEYAMTDALVTTCTNKAGEYHYHVTAKELHVRPGEAVKARGAVFFIGPVPVMYMPYWRKSLSDDFGFRFFAGASSRMGAFLLSSYRYRINETLKGETHLDYRTKRGVAVGQDFMWRQPDGGNYGEINGYYLDDKDPKSGDDYDDSVEVDSRRYRVKIKDAWEGADADYALLQAQYLSDAKMLEHFFEDEYRESSQPDNYASYTHRGESYTANLLARGRLNDFYSGVNRLPEASIVFSRQRLDESPFYYDGQTAAAFLQKVWEETSTEEDYSSFRFDSAHTVYYPTKQFGFLNVTPRSGYRATYYSATREPVETTVLTTNYTVNSDGTTNSSISTNSATKNLEKSGQLRSLFEVGLETSFKAFNVWEAEDGMPLRHIVEPYANYTLVPEPNLAPDNIYQFDEVDDLDKQQTIKVGARNKIQTKRGSQPFNFFDLDAYTVLNLDREEGESFFDFVYFKGQINTLWNLTMDFDASYSAQESSLETFYTQLRYSDPATYSTSLDYRFTKDESSLISEDTTFYLSKAWHFNLYGRYEFEDSQLEEIGGYLQRNLDCMSVRAGAGFLPGYTQSDGDEIPDEWRLTFEFWLTAFPNVSLSGSHRN